MPTLTATPKQLAIAIGRHCRKCVCQGNAKSCVSADCDLYRFRLGYQVVPDPLHLFSENDKTSFFSQCDKALFEIESTGAQTFTFDDIRALVKVKPLSVNWWGSWSKRLADRGYTKVGFQPSKHELANGRMISVWSKKGE